MSRALPKYNKRRVGIIGGAAAVVLSGAVIAGSALAGEGANNNGQDAAANAGPGTISCPAVEGSLPAIPASAQAEVDRNLALLDTQVQEANQRLIDTVGQGGANFVQNAILGPLEDKRVATLNRIETAIGRTAAKPEGLEALAPCQLNQGGAAGAGEEAEAGAGAEAGAEAGAGEDAGNAGAAGTITCPEVEGSLPEIPASAQAEVDRNLALLDTQIQEANQRLIDTVGQGGANFVDNAILGPLEDKRVATLNRIETAIGRTAAKPEGLEALAPCQLNQ
jgi:F0F1-type ATP synthase membrane subunit b/b'